MTRGKNPRLGPSFALVKCSKKKSKPWDITSLLPDEILVSLLKLLSFKEAASTSVLSSRWEHLWKLTSRLDFDATNTLNIMAEKYPIYGTGRTKIKWLNLRKVARDKYVDWINQVLKLHRGSTLEEFRVCFDLDKVNQNDIDNWIEFAFMRSTQRLELDLVMSCGLPCNDGQCYILSADLFTRTNLLRQPPLNHHGETFNPFKSLKSLCLKSINVSGEVLQFFLSSCHNLERLVVHGSKSLVNFEVSGQSLMLRHLEICNCSGESIKITDCSLVSFTYLGGKRVVMLDNLPMLVEVHLGWTFILSDVIFELSSYLSQIEVLILQTIKAENTAELQEFPILTRLKHLVLVVGVYNDESLMGFTSLLKASPYLERFVFEIKYECPQMKSFEKETIKPEACRHANLRVVEQSGYQGRPSDLEAAMYILENAVALEHLIIDPRDSFDYTKYTRTSRTPITKSVLKLEEGKRKRAKEHFEGKVPPNVKLTIL